MTFPRSVRRAGTEVAGAPGALGCRSSRPSIPKFVSVSLAPELGGILHVARRGPAAARPAAARAGSALGAGLPHTAPPAGERPRACPCPRHPPGGGGRELFRFSISYLKGEEGERMNELLTAAEPRFPRLSNICKYLCCGWSPPPRLSCLVCRLFVPNPALRSV